MTKTCVKNTCFDQYANAMAVGGCFLLYLKVHVPVVGPAKVRIPRSKAYRHVLFLLYDSAVDDQLGTQVPVLRLGQGVRSNLQTLSHTPRSIATKNI